MRLFYQSSSLSLILSTSFKLPPPFMRTICSVRAVVIRLRKCDITRLRCSCSEDSWAEQYQGAWTHAGGGDAMLEERFCWEGLKTAFRNRTWLEFDDETT